MPPELTGSIDVNFCGPSGSCYHISVGDFNGTPCIGIGDFSVVIKLEDLDGLTRTLNDSVELWKSLSLAGRTYNSLVGDVKFTVIQARSDTE